MAISPINGLVFSSAFVGGMNAARFDNFLTQARTNLDPEESVIFVYDGVPAHRNPTVPAPNTELKMLPPYSPFLNIVEQAISCLKAAMKADISRPDIQRRMDDRDEARVRGIPLGEYRTQQLLYMRLCTEILTRLQQLKVRNGTASCRPICQNV